MTPPTGVPWVDPRSGTDERQETGRESVYSREAWQSALSSGSYDQQCASLRWGKRNHCKTDYNSTDNIPVEKLKYEALSSPCDLFWSSVLSVGPLLELCPLRVTSFWSSVISVLPLFGALSSPCDLFLELCPLQSTSRSTTPTLELVKNDPAGSQDSLTQQPVMRSLASAILQVAQSVGAKYMQKPLELLAILLITTNFTSPCACWPTTGILIVGTLPHLTPRFPPVSMFTPSGGKHPPIHYLSPDESPEDKQTVWPAMERWEISLMASTSFAQLFLHLFTLDNSIQWSKSALNAHCRICRGRRDPENMLLCDGCNKGHHLYCLKPKLSKIPAGDWFCHKCRPKDKVRTPKKSRRLFSEESDQEEIAEDKSAVTCSKCGFEGRLAHCEGCSRYFHKKCCVPHLKKIHKHWRHLNHQLFPLCGRVTATLWPGDRHSVAGGPPLCGRGTAALWPGDRRSVAG
uniref:Bromodomain adjacent to zinc finger domain protein 1A n=1 Tax=Timema shepardi TaxID=629360 RepID=A0A7R9G3Y8_TIMSH|nr:unnamed protein product [Timema shepardi]